MVITNKYQMMVQNISPVGSTSKWAYVLKRIVVMFCNYYLFLQRVSTFFKFHRCVVRGFPGEAPAVPGGTESLWPGRGTRDCASNPKVTGTPEPNPDDEGSPGVGPQNVVASGWADTPSVRWYINRGFLGSCGGGITGCHGSVRTAGGGGDFAGADVAPEARASASWWWY